MMYKFIGVVVIFVGFMVMTNLWNAFLGDVGFFVRRGGIRLAWLARRMILSRIPHI